MNLDITSENVNNKSNLLCGILPRGGISCGGVL